MDAYGCIWTNNKDALGCKRMPSTPTYVNIGQCTSICVQYVSNICQYTSNIRRTQVKAQLEQQLALEKTACAQENAHAKRVVNASVQLGMKINEPAVTKLLNRSSCTFGEVTKLLKRSSCTFGEVAKVLNVSSCTFGEVFMSFLPFLPMRFLGAQENALRLQSERKLSERTNALRAAKNAAAEATAAEVNIQLV